MNGADKESLDDAYTNYKKTIGTFDTLITCRDYMNKIYLLTEGDISGSASTTPLVSNIIASDIRDDINKAVTICSFTENGITYENAPVKKDGNDLISHFDLVLYPFTPYVGINSRADFKNSFKYTNKNVSKIKSGINENKTISHNIVLPENKDLACVKNYIKVKAKITTTKKVNSVEEKSILKNVYAALYKKFNMRKLEFGEQITDEMISEAIESADSRIKNVWVTTENEIRFAQVDGTELKAADSADSDSNNTYHNTCLQLATLNVLAGRVPLFNYDTKFKPSLDEKKNNEYENVFYPINPASVAEYITKIVTSYEPDLPGEAELTLNDNEVIQFRKPNFKTTTTYPAYVNYFIKLTSKGDTEAKAATFMTLQDFFGGTNDYICELVNGGQVDLTKIIAAEGDTISSLESKYAFVLAKDPETGKYGRAQSLTAGAEYYTVKFNPSLTPATLIQVNEFVKTKLEEQTKRSTQNNCLYKTASADLSRVPGYLVDSNHIKYILSTQAIIDSSCTLDLEYRV